MGMLAESFVKAAYSNFRESGSDDDDATEIQISFMLSLEEGDATRSERRKALMRVVEERNKLIHQWVAEFDSDSIDSCRQLSIALDEQREPMLPELEFLREIASMMVEHGKEVLKLVHSDDFNSKFKGRVDEV